MKLSKSHRLLTTAKQWIDPRPQIEAKTLKLAQLIKSSKYPIFFTGAGCSTSIGIPDYRSGHSTKVQTGVGAWNRSDNDEVKAIRQKELEITIEKARPSLTHLAIKTLLRKNIFKFLVSQNTDGFHLKSGVLQSQIAELHGNRNLENCIACRRSYLRDFRVLNSHQAEEKEKKKHLTGRKCENCGSDLTDSIVYFSETLPEQILRKSYEEAYKCDLCLCVGSSLTVRPSVNVPIFAQQAKAKLCIINLQQTPLDSHSTLKINDFCDNSLSSLMNHLQIDIDPYAIEHYIELSTNTKILSIEGKDENWNNFTFIKSVRFGPESFPPHGHHVQVQLPTEENCSSTQIELHFYGNKPSITLNFDSLSKLKKGGRVRLKLQKQQQKPWQVSVIQ